MTRKPIPRIQVDRSGVGHHWVAVDDDSLPANIREEIEAEIIDGGTESTNCFVASNGMHYRWSVAGSILTP